MLVRIMKAGVLCIVAASILLLIGFHPNRSNNQQAIVNVLAHSAPAAAAVSGEAPGTGVHDLKILEKALVKKPGHTPVLMNLARLEEEKGQFDEAAKHLTEIVDQDSGNLEARLELGKVLFQRGDVQGALKQTRAILEVQPRNPDALYNLGAIYGNLGNAAMAREYWGRLIALDPKSESGQRAQRMMPQLAGLSR